MAAILDFGNFFFQINGKKIFNSFKFILAFVKTLYRDISHHEMFYLMLISKKPVFIKIPNLGVGVTVLLLQTLIYNVERSK